MASTRWGIIAAGKISHDFVTCLRSISNHDVVAVAANNAENAKKFAETHSIPKVLDNYNDFASQDNIDIVYCGTINPFHFGVVKHLLENGKAVLCEKPLTMCLEDTEDLVKIAQREKVFLMEAMWSRFQPVYGILSKRLTEIGEVQSVEVSFGQRQIGQVERAIRPDLGGSAMLDIGIYAVNFCQTIFNDADPVEVRAVGEVSTEGVDLQSAVVLKYPSGKLATMTISVSADLPCEATVFGSKGSIKLHKPFWSPEIIEVNGVKEIYPLPETVLPCNFINSSGLRYEAEHVRDCLLKGLKESPVYPLKTTVQLARVMQTALDQMGAKLKRSPR